MARSRSIWRIIYESVGFSKPYNFILWFIFCGALMGFTLARLEYFSYDIFCQPNGGAGSGAAPGECFYYQGGHYKAGIYIHLGGILPAAFLACFQFTPVIRHKFLLFHRVNGYTILILAQVSSAGALMIARRAFGGTLPTQAGIGMLVLLFESSLILAYINIKRLQIDQHRAWMLRAWFYAASIITLRIIMIICAEIISGMEDYYFALPCDKLNYLIGSQQGVTTLFPSCTAYYSGQDPNAAAAVIDYMNGKKENVAAALDASFGMALWLALFLHAAGVEIYLSLTRGETARLRQLSYERQLKAGFKNPGSAGITFDRISDQRWVPNVEQSKEYEVEADANADPSREASKFSQPDEIDAK